MKRFVWRLQRILELKTRQEQQKTTELLRLSEHLAQTRGELLVQQRILKQIISEIAAEAPQKRLLKQEFFLRNSAATDERIKKLKTKITELEKQQREKINELLKVRRFREALERLREQAKRRFIAAQEKLEQKESDEATTTRFARKQQLLSTQTRGC